MDNVFQYLPNFARESDMEFTTPVGVHRSDFNKEQRYSNALREVISYSGGTYYNLDTVRRYSAEYSAIGSIKDSVLLNRLQALRGGTVLLPVFLEPMAATADLQGQTVATIDGDVELALTEIKLFTGYVVRLDLSDRHYFECLAVTSSIQTMLNTGQITVATPWQSSIPAARCRLYFADTVYPGTTVRQNADSDQVHHIRIEWASV